MPIDHYGSVKLTKRKRGQKKFLQGKNVFITDLKGRNAVLKKKLKDANNQLEQEKRVKELYMKQSDNMSETIANFLNSDLSGGSRGSSNALARHVADELTWEYRRLKKNEARTEWELTCLEKKTMCQKEKLEDLTADLKITLVNLNERERELKKRRKEIEKLSRENVLLREESAAFIEEDKEEEEEDRRESYGRKKGNQLPDGLRTLVLKLYKMRLSTEQVRSVLAGMMEEMNMFTN